MTQNLIYKGEPIRFYQVKDDLLLPSVTTILSHTQDKEWMYRIIEKWGQEVWDDYVAEAAGRGTIMHEWLEQCYVNKIDNPGKLLVMNDLGSLDSELTREQERAALLLSRFYKRKWIFEMRNVIGYETPVYYIEKGIGGYAGRFDMYIRDFRKMKVLLDFKSTTFVRSEDDIWNYFMQIAAYWRAIQSMGIYETPDEAQILMVSDGKIDWGKRFRISKEDAKLWYCMFRGAIWEFNQNVLPQIIDENPVYKQKLESVYQ